MDYASRTVPEFLSAIASERVTPAGGTAAGVVGAIGAALCEMGCLHALANDDRVDARNELAEIRDELRARRETLLDLGTRDAEVVDRLFGAAGDDPEDGDPERAIGVPLAIAEACLDVVEAGVVVLERGEESTAVDTRTGVCLARAALDASLYTVRRNLESADDAPFVEDVGGRSDDVEAAADRAVEEMSAVLADRR